MSTNEDENRNGPREGAVEPMDKPSAGYATDGSATPSPRQLATKRVAVFVDGFNLYYGLHEHSGRKHLWLDLNGLSTSLLKPDQRLVGVNYFTARRRNDREGAARQGLYIGALKATGVRVVEGRFQEKTHTCRTCEKSWRSYEEKESDVNLCVALMEAAREHHFDTALIVSGDSDMAPGVRAVRRMNHGLRMIAVFPPKRFSAELKSVVDASFHLGAAKIRQAQLPDEVVGEDVVYQRPAYWA